MRAAAAARPGARPGSAPRRRCVAVMASAKPVLMVNSCTGKMGRSVAEAAVAAGLQLAPFTLCGAAEAAGGKSIDVAGVQMQLVGPDARDAVIEQVKQQHPGLVMVDYTVPDVIHEMAGLYIKHRTPFVMGTTGGDRERLVADVVASGVYAVIAPQMGKQVVAFQATMELMAETFPGAFAGYTLKVTESHQSSKKDTSGTAKAIVSSFQGLGLKFDVSQIELVRDREQQLGRMRVPEEALPGHAFHTYQLVSPDGSVAFEFQHNVCGRTIYAEGTVDAALFLARQVEQGASQTLYNMVDVLRAGAMR
ncbi:DAPB1 [Scenedesmus sp. PABB004]|nr:DAPB1 [Scenedesmus sp. PABB004]